MTECVSAKTLRVGFFDGTLSFLHLSNIKIINLDGVDVAKTATFSATSTSTANQSPGPLRNILTDGNPETFSHTERLVNQYLVIDFANIESIRQIIIENRNDTASTDGIRNRIKNLQFRLYLSTDIVYESNKISTVAKYYHVNVISKDVVSSLPSVDLTENRIIKDTPVSDYINAKLLRFGFFDGRTQLLHLCNIKIINANDVDIAKSCTFTLFSPHPSQSPGQLRDILVDSNAKTFCHSQLKPNQYLKIDFGKVVSIKQIIIENRSENLTIQDRILNAQFRLYDEDDIAIFKSDKISVANQYYYIQGNQKKVITGQPRWTVKVADMNDPCNNGDIRSKNLQLNMACGCKEATELYSARVKQFNTENEQYNIDLEYYKNVNQNRSDWKNKINDYANWKTKESELQNEKRRFKNCRPYTGTMTEWDSVCKQDYGNGWYVLPKINDSFVGCGLFAKGLCQRLPTQVSADLKDAGYFLFEPPQLSEPKKPTPVEPANILCCSQNISGLQADTVNISGISQQCDQTITSMIEKSLESAPVTTPLVTTSPPTSPPTTPPTTPPIVPLTAPQALLDTIAIMIGLDTTSTSIVIALIVIVLIAIVILSLRK
jgi:sporulation protein YlmC with PRC-barrel domain